MQIQAIEVKVSLVEGPQDCADYCGEVSAKFWPEYGCTLDEERVKAFIENVVLNIKNQDKKVNYV